MDRSRNRRAWQDRIGLRLASITVAALAGCSELRGSRPSEMPKLGPFEAPAYDPYLSAHQPTKPAEKRAVAQAEGPDVAMPRLQVVRLEPPVSLPVAKPVSTPSRDPFAEAEGIIATARARVDAMANYQVQVNRQERVGGALLPAEDVVLSIRREPRAVRLEWLDGSHKGREVIYSTSDPSGLMHVRMAESLIPVPNLALAPDSPLVMRSSRHPITEAGFDTIIRALEKSIVAGRTDPTKVGYPGIETPPLVGRPCHKLTQTLGDEQWLVYVDAETSLPAMIQATSSSGDLLERYLFRSVKPDLPDLMAANAFDANLRWGNSTGFLSRIARSGGGDAKATATPVIR